MSGVHKLLTRPNIILALLLGCGLVMTAGSAWLVLLLASYKGPDAAVIIAVGGLANGLLACLGIIGAVVLVLALIILNIDRMSLSAGPVQLNMDRADPPPVTATATVTVASSTEGAK